MTWSGQAWMVALALGSAALTADLAQPGPAEPAGLRVGAHRPGTPWTHWGAGRHRPGWDHGHHGHHGRPGGAGHVPSWHHGPRVRPGWYAPAPVWIPPRWVWIGYGWFLAPGYWR
jgi:hypothetical protein